jgi:DNA-binding GntR family transcriptional regulator
MDLAEVLRDAIRAGDLPAGAAIRQEEIAARYHVSRLPVRDALMKLHGEGLVVVEPNRGAFVRELSAPEIEEVFDIRMMLELDLIVRSAGQITRRDLAEIRRIHLAIGDAETAEENAELDRTFHEVAYRAAARPRQLQIVMSLRSVVGSYEKLRARFNQARAAFQKDHLSMMKALAAGDAGTARAALQVHLERTRVIAINAAKGDA